MAKIQAMTPNIRAIVSNSIYLIEYRLLPHLTIELSRAVRDFSTPSIAQISGIHNAPGTASA